MSKKWLTRGNAKIDKNTLIWSIPAVLTCGRHCKGCYAYIAQQRFPTIKKGRELRYLLSIGDSFVETISAKSKIRVLKSTLRSIDNPYKPKRRKNDT